MSIYTSIPAYVYKLTCTVTNQFYHGFRKAHIKKNRLVANDFMIYYWSSSLRVADLIKQHGKESFIGEILFTSDNHIDVFLFEQEQIKMHKGDPNLLNQYYQTPTSDRVFLSSNTNKAVETRKRNGTLNSNPAVIAKSQATRIANGTNTLSPESAVRAAATRIINGTNKRSPEVIAKSLETKRVNGTLHRTPSPATIAKQMETKQRNNTVSSSTPESIAKGIATSLSRGSKKRTAESTAKQRATKLERGTNVRSAAAIAKSVATTRANGNYKRNQASIDKGIATKLANGGSPRSLASIEKMVATNKANREAKQRAKQDGTSL